MKEKILTISLIISSLTGCERHNEPTSCLDCVGFTFEQTYLKYFQDDEVYFIKDYRRMLFFRSKNIGWLCNRKHKLWM